MYRYIVCIFFHDKSNTIFVLLLLTEKKFPPSFLLPVRFTKLCNFTGFNFILHLTVFGISFYLYGRKFGHLATVLIWVDSLCRPWTFPLLGMPWEQFCWQISGSGILLFLAAGSGIRNNCFFLPDLISENDYLNTGPVPVFSLLGKLWKKVFTLYENPGSSHTLNGRLPFSLSLLSCVKWRCGNLSSYPEHCLRHRRRICCSV
jgi:hypothetical protein